MAVSVFLDGDDIHFPMATVSVFNFLLYFNEKKLGCFFLRNVYPINK